MPAPAAPRVTDSAPHLGYSLGVTAAIIVLVGLGIAYAIDAAARTSRAAVNADDRVLSRTLGGRELTVPAAWFRYAVEEEEGFARQVELRLELPLGTQATPSLVDVTLLSRSAVRPSAGLLDGLYLHLFQSDEVDGPPGLIGKPLRPGEGYQQETVWYDPLSPHPFVAKCVAPVVEGASGRCLRSVYLGPGIAATYSFDDPLLAHWRDFDAAIRPMLERIGALDPADGT